jgi:predicted dehydrogenase
MKTKFNRRQFIRRSSLAASGVFFIGASASFGKAARSPNEKLNIGCIGTSNRARANINGVKGENIVAVCDIDQKFLDGAKRDFPGAKTYSDFRKLIEQSDIDAIVVATPDHTHAVAAIAALKSGRPVYCEKPLTRTISELRKLLKAAQDSKLPTQMGNQIHSTPHYRRVVELVQRGVIGTVSEVHCWADHLWPQADPTPGQVPANLNYDLWLGPVKPIPYSTDYHPFNWRRWWHFGGGTLSDFCCHLMDLPYWALDLKHPQTIEADGPPVHPQGVPPQLKVTYTYGPQGRTRGLKMFWYSGGRRPEVPLPQWGNGVLFIGDKGMLLTDYGKHVLLPEKSFVGFQPPKPFIPESPGHHEEWIRACKGQGKPACHFGYGALLTEAGLLGNVAYRTGKKIEWDAEAMKAKNCPEADQYIHHDYREGWTI